MSFKKGEIWTQRYAPGGRQGEDAKRTAGEHEDGQLCAKERCLEQTLLLQTWK